MTANKVSNAMNNNQLMDDDNLDDEFLPSPLYDSMKTHQSFEHLLDNAKSVLNTRADFPFSSMHKQTLKKLEKVDKAFLKQVTLALSTDDVKKDQLLASKLEQITQYLLERFDFLPSLK
ncbi:hypothetical protein NP7_09655 (plasmid) [Moraxella osloensis]|uniref:Uncharacterized protein n=2 Tax=Faucicola osloensis TaxID=34062 RepID=A0A2D2LX68_FAUOS|nr:hypothetical protein NP7_09655 [Moraxella osloensis]